MDFRQPMSVFDMVDASSDGGDIGADGME